MIQNVSFTSLQVYGQCPLHAKLRFDEKIPEPPQPEGEVSPLERGSEIHDKAEAYLRGSDELPLETLSPQHVELLDYYKSLADDPRTEIEAMWRFNPDWVPLQPGEWGDPYSIFVKLDFFHQNPDEGTATAVDWKTGKKYRNEVKHAHQMQFYATAVFMRYPEIEVVDTDLVYFDAKERTERTYDRPILVGIFPKLQRSIETMTQDRQYLAKPSVLHCAYCPYKTGQLGKSKRMGTGHCKLNP